MSKNLRTQILANQRQHPEIMKFINKPDKYQPQPKKKDQQKKGILLMAIGHGSKSKEAVEFKNYIGIASCHVLGIAPDQKTLETFYGKTIDAPSYLGETELKDGQKVKSVRIDILLKVDGEHHKTVDGKPLELLLKKAFFISDAQYWNKDHTKVMVIDKYGRTAWVTEGQLNDHAIPMYSNGPANIDADYRPAYMGELGLTEFIRSFLCIPSVGFFDTKTNSYKMVDNPEDCLIRLDNIADYFKEDYRELHEVYNLQPSNKVKVLVGVKASNGNIFQDIFDTVSTNGCSLNRCIAKFTKLVQDAKDNGRYNNTDFKMCDLEEYSPKASDLTKSFVAGAAPIATPVTDDDLPF